jgi:hypothetical protein
VVYVVAEGKEDGFNSEIKGGDEQILVPGVEIPGEEADTDRHLGHWRGLDDIFEGLDLLLQIVDSVVACAMVRHKCVRHEGR